MERTKFVFSAFADEIDPGFDAQLDALRRLGIRRLELRGVDGKSFTELTDAEAETVKKKLDNAGVSLSSLGSPIGKIKADDDFETHKALFLRVMELGERLDCKRIRMFSFYPGALDRDSFERAVFSRTEELLSMAEKRGFTLCHENEKGIYGCSPQEEKRLLDRFGGRLKAVLDPGNFAFCRLDASEGYPLLKDYVEYLHIKDADENGIIVPPGKGVAGLAETLTAIASDRPGQTVLLTMEPHLTDFVGLASLSAKGELLRRKYVFSSPFEAFRTAYEAVKDMAERAGTVPD